MALVEWQQQFTEAKRLSNVTTDPETAPYQSKYAANAILESLHGQLSTPHELAMVELQLGINHMNTEENHNAVPRLEACLGRFYEGLSERINEAAPIVGDGGEGEVPSPPSSPLVAGDVSITDEVRLNGAVVVDALNHLGIIWCGREAPSRAHLYLQQAERVYTALLTSSASTESESESESVSVSVSEEELESLHTHTLYYLAQTSALLKDAPASARYCQRTLKRQLSASVAGSASMAAAQAFDSLDWTSNCQGLVEYYCSTQRVADAAHCLDACDCVLRDAFGGPPNEKEADAAADLETRAEARAKIDRSWGRLYQLVLGWAKELDQIVLGGGGGNGQQQLDEFDEAEREVDFGDLLPGIAAKPPAPVSPVAVQRGGFDAARAVFRAANARLEAAKQHFVLDGFVTDHVCLLQQQSALYKDLAHFEKDDKRALAMHGRRCDLLQPLLPALNREVYIEQHYQVAFELGQTFSDMLDLKLARAEAKVKAGGRAKRAELVKCNAYCRQALDAYDHFIEQFRLQKKAPESLDAQELGPYLRAHFYQARLLGKTDEFGPGGDEARVDALTASLRKYEWLQQTAPPLLKALEGGGGDAVFGGEMGIVEQMVELLPESINRLHYAAASR